MDSVNYPEIVNQPDIDDESKDEYEYDEKATCEALEWIERNTKNSPVFQELYLLAAARMFSIDADIGITILLSYDYLFYFHPILSEFIQQDGYVDKIKVDELKMKLTAK
jgi:hypothetical protein